MMHLPALWFASGTWLSHAPTVACSLTLVKKEHMARTFTGITGITGIAKNILFKYEYAEDHKLPIGHGWLTWINHSQSSFVTFTMEITMEITIQNAPRFLHPGRIFHPETLHPPSNWALRTSDSNCKAPKRLKRLVSAAWRRQRVLSSSGFCGFGKGGRAKNIEPKRVGCFLSEKYGLICLNKDDNGIILGN